MIFPFIFVLFCLSVQPRLQIFESEKKISPEESRLICVAQFASLFVYFLIYRDISSEIKKTISKT